MSATPAEIIATELELGLIHFVPRVIGEELIERLALAGWRIVPEAPDTGLSAPQSDAEGARGIARPNDPFDDGTTVYSEPLSYASSVRTMDDPYRPAERIQAVGGIVRDGGLIGKEDGPELVVPLDANRKPWVRVSADPLTVQLRAPWPPPAPGTHESDLEYVRNAPYLPGETYEAFMDAMAWSRTHTPKEPQP